MKRKILSTLALLICTIGLTLAQGNPIATAMLTANPVDSRVELVFEEALNEHVTLVVKDLTGKTVFTLRPDVGGEDCKVIPLDFEHLRRGIYILQITGDSGKVKTLKFQKN